MYLILLVAISVSAASPTECPPCNPVCDEATTPITCFHPLAPENPPQCYCNSDSCSGAPTIASNKMPIQLIYLEDFDGP